MTVLTDTKPNTKQKPWILMRRVTTDDTPLDATTKVWSTVAGLFFPLPFDWEKMFLAFLCYGDGTGGGNPESGTFSFNILSVRENGSAQIVAQGTAEVGALRASHDPVSGQLFSDASEHKWVQQPVITLDAWRTPVVASGTSDDLGNLCWSPQHDYGVFVEITSIVSITSIDVYASGDEGS